MFGWLALIVGILYGYLAKGKQDKGGILKTGIIWGLVIAVVLAAIGYFLDSSPVGFGTGVVAIFISFVIVTVLFVLGVFIGDWFEHRGKKATI